jgi:hypothetical protein
VSPAKDYNEVLANAYAEKELDREVPYTSIISRIADLQASGMGLQSSEVKTQDPRNSSRKFKRDP